MSCEECEKYNEGQRMHEGVCYIRVGNGNVAILGCDKHLKMLIERNRREQIAEVFKKVTDPDEIANTRGDKDDA